MRAERALRVGSGGIVAALAALAMIAGTGAASIAHPRVVGTEAAASASGPPAWRGDGAPIVATFSIVACDTAAGICGVAVASKFLAVGSVVPWARGNVGAVATQASANTTWGPRALDLLERGLTPEEILPVLLRSDPQRAHRQIGIVDAHGRAATYTGDSCLTWAGGRSGPGYAAQGNILAGPQVVAAMAPAFERSRGFLGDRLLAALAAGDSAGGDSRGHQSAAIRLASVGGGYNGFNDVLCDLRVEDHADPLGELRRVYGLWRSVRLVNDGYRLVEEKRYAEAIALGEEAARLDPDSGEPFYHLACFEARSGDAGQAMHYLQWALRLRPALRAQAAQDPDLATLRGREDYRTLVGN